MAAAYAAAFAALAAAFAACWDAADVCAELGASFAAPCACVTKYATSRVLISASVSEGGMGSCDRNVSTIAAVSGAVAGWYFCSQKCVKITVIGPLIIAADVVAPPAWRAVFIVLGMRLTM